MLAVGFIQILADDDDDDTDTDMTLTQCCNNFSSGPIQQQAVVYQHITVLDKQYIQRTLLSDVYNVIYKTESGEIEKIDNMTLYYSVEKGHTYNVSYDNMPTGIVMEV